MGKESKLFGTSMEPKMEPLSCKFQEANVEGQRTGLDKKSLISCIVEDNEYEVKGLGILMDAKSTTG
jgi:hypothetical protein